MVGSGFEPEVAATSFRNLTRALTKGSQATKAQRTAFKALGLDAVKTAKGMQKNAVQTTLDVLDRIKKLPEYQQISIASALFGDEARGLAPLFKNADELRRLLTMTGDAANYSGSAFKEYVTRANTASNVLTILRDKVADVFRGIGDDMLPDIKEAALGVGDVIDSLGERATVFDRMSSAMKGFAQGLGMDGGVRETVNAIGDLLFGKADGSGAADQLGRIFEQFRQGGAAIRAFWEANKDSPVAKFLGEVSGYGFNLMLASVGIGLIAGSVRKLASAFLFLSGASTAWGILQGLAGFGGGLFGGKVMGGNTPSPKAPPSGGGGGLMALLGRLTPWIPALSLSGSTPKSEGTWEDDPRAPRWREEWERLNRKSHGDERGRDTSLIGIGERERSLDDFIRGPVTQASGGLDVAAALRDTIIQTAPTGIQQVQVTNPPERPNVNMPITVYMQGSSDPKATADEIGRLVKDRVEGIFSDGWMG